MADNIATTPGSGATIAADDVGGILYQRTKLVVGNDGVANDVYHQQNVGDGQTGANMFPVGLAVWNGASWDRQRGNTEGTLLASAARTTTTGSATQTNHNARGVVLFLNITAGASPSLALQIVAVDPVSSTGVQFAPNSTAATATGLYYATFYPGVGTNANQLASQSIVLPRSWQAYVVAGNGNSITYSLGYSLVI